MINNVFKLNGKFIAVANSWDDLSFAQYERILDIKDNDIAEMISIITNVPRETLDTADIIGLEPLLEVAQFLTIAPEWPQYTDKIGGHKIPANKDGRFDIRFESLGQFEDMRKIMTRCTTVRDLTKAYPEFVAIYLQKIIDGEYSYTKATSMISDVRRMPAKEVMALGSFFYAKLRSLLTGTPPSSPSTPQNQKKSRQALKRSTKGSARTRR